MAHIKEKIIDFLERHSTISLATSYNNIPHAATVFYINRGLEIFFLSSPTSRHGRDIAENPRVAGSISREASDWKQIEGLQIKGAAACVGRIPENAALAGRYVKKFPSASRLLLNPRDFPPDIAEKLLKARFYRIVPERFILTENALGFGHREEFQPL